ncbi:MAG: hypothetical protein ACI9OJ_003154 [Myxococcota bacterium]|jgi:hypothetical protein
MLRYHLLFNGTVLAGHSRDRRGCPTRIGEGRKFTDRRRAAALVRAHASASASASAASRHPWAWLLRRVFAVDIMTCSHRQGAMRVKSIATEADEVRAVLGTVPRARPPPPLRQLELDFAAA